MTRSVFFRIGLVAACIFLPVTTYSADSMDAIVQLQKIIEQQKLHIATLEAENSFFKNMLASNNVQIPLDLYMKVLGTPAGISMSKAPESATGSIFIPKAINREATEQQLSILPATQRGFIQTVQKDWEVIKETYSMPDSAHMGGYEFLKDDPGKVYVDIMYEDEMPDKIYSAKLLYAFNTTTFERTFIGFFEYSQEYKGYITRKGKNPFPKSERIVVLNPYLTIMTVDPTNTNTSPNVPVSSPSPLPPSEEKNLQKVLTELSAAYAADQDKRVIQITDEFLKNHAPHKVILSYRYRTFFIQQKYAQALAEIQKMETLGFADNIVYCDAHTIALYAGNSKLIAEFKKKAGAKCNA